MVRIVLFRHLVVTCLNVVNHQRRGDGLYIGFWSAYTDTVLDCQFVNLEAESYKDREPEGLLEYLVVG